jgi:hypothetical protein
MINQELMLRTDKRHLDQAEDFGLLHVCGYPSSGTTLLRSILNSHPDISVKNEMPLILKALSEAPRELTADAASDLLDALEKDDLYKNFSNLQDLRADLLKAKAEHPAKTYPIELIYALALDGLSYRWYGNKTPQYTEQMDILLKVFPDTKVILIVRDVRDIALSYRKKWGRDVYLCSAKWAQRMRQGRKQIESLPQGQGMVMRYEDLVADPEKHARELCEFLGLPFSATMLEHNKYDKDKPKGKRELNDRPIAVDHVAKWKKEFSDKELARIEAVAYNTMVSFGYPPERATAQINLSKSARIAGELKNLWSQVAVGNRYNKDQSLRTRLKNLSNTLRRLALRRS